MSKQVTIAAVFTFLVCTSACVTSARAQQAGVVEGFGTVSGIARDGQSGAPISFAMVRLLSADTKQTVMQQRLTNAVGAYRFGAVAPGVYRLQLLRIGYAPVQTGDLAVRAGEPTHRDLVGSTVAITLAAITVRPKGQCLRSAVLAQDAQLSALWDDARQGVEIRRAFQSQYRFTVNRVEVSEMRRGSGAPSPRFNQSSLVNDPGANAIREDRLRHQRQVSGYGTNEQFQLPDETELFDDAFLTDYCLENEIATESDKLGLQFRPVRPSKGGYSIRGTIWVDSATHLVRQLQLEYMDDAISLGKVRIDYANVVVEGRPLLLPSTARFEVKSTRTRAGASLTGTLTYRYDDFEELKGRFALTR